MSPTPLPPRCWAEIDLAALGRNLTRIRSTLPAGTRVMSVVKADAYGHGLQPTAARLAQAGADLFAVANLTEAAALRDAVPDRPILLLGPLFPEEDAFLPGLDVAVTLSSADEIARFDALGRAAGRPIAVHLKIDTGMGRLGIWHEDAAALYQTVRAARHVRLAGLFTHFASSDSDRAFTAEQRRRFRAFLDGCPGLDPAAIFIHADNSAGLETRVDDGVTNTIRVGLLQYGVAPGAHPPAAPTEPVLSLHARVGLVRRLPRGATVSYGQTRRLARDSIVAVLGAGYADGLARAASNRAAVLLRGQRCPVLGRITMDLTMVDATDVPGIQAGDEAVLIGRQGTATIAVSEFSGWANTIPWESLCAISKRVPRIYKD